jgi:hypothetical protein
LRDAHGRTPTDPPTAGVSYSPSDPEPGETVSLVSESSDSDGEVVASKWTVDGEVVGEQDSLDYAFEDPGEYVVSLTVVDDDARNSTARPFTVGRTLSVDTRIPERELLLAIKLHSGRFTDARDVVAVAADADFDSVETQLHRGDADALAEQLASISEQLADGSFIDSFKGEFQQQSVPEETIERVRDFLAGRQERLR